MPPALRVNFLVADGVEDILPKLREAARGLPKPQDNGSPGRRL